MNTKFRQVRAARRVIPYVLYDGLYSLGCGIIPFEGVPAPLIYPGCQGYMNPNQY
jgi:hypothetical protein